MLFMKKNKQYVTMVIIMVMVSMLLPDSALAGNGTRIFTDPDLGTTNPKYRFSRLMPASLSSLGDDVWLVNKMMRSKEKTYSKLTDQINAVLLSHIELEPVSFSR